MIRLETVFKRYGSGPEILRDVSCVLAPGSFHFITGASGAGKTTLLNIVALVDQPSGGTVRLFDTDTAAASRRERARLRRRIGMLFQDRRFADELSVAENVGLPLRIEGTPARQRQDNVAALLDWLALTDKSAVRLADLSVVDRQRVALAAAVVRGPDLLIADEPTGTAGEAEALLLMEALDQMTQRGTTVLVATRDDAFAQRFPHPRLHLDDGILSAEVAAP